jgi:hypothetical protein
MATYATQVQWGGSGAPWHDNGPLDIEIVNGKQNVPATGAPASEITVTWSGALQSATITFNGNTFSGTLTNPGEGPVGYSGTLVNATQG